ncbi:uncharacterized protein LOC143879121 [Tasmannia lanceolata]|uniref:uncharacterized protein LOC143879121 n=1 Tax=Tasmannia lanceolata TaxID=3420 RepID=UPI004063BE6B
MFRVPEGIWEELLSVSASEEQVYIISWSDHFFVLKVESDAIYIIDTLGERLCEGCNQAYILRFNKESTVYRRKPEESNGKVEPNGRTDTDSSSAGLNIDGISSQEILCEGKDSCREFIKGFFAALPLRELKDDINRGLVGKGHLHQRLQIEFHSTAPRNKIVGQQANRISDSEIDPARSSTVDIEPHVD